MALVRNTLEHELTLTVGTIGPRAELNIDATLDYEASLVFDGTLEIVDGSEPPPEPAEPFIGRARPVYVGQTEPPSLPIGGVWFDKTAGAVKERTLGGLVTLATLGGGLDVTNPPGTAGQYLKANGDGTFTWTSFSTVSVYDGGTP